MVIPVIIAGSLLTLGALMSGGKKKKKKHPTTEVEEVADELADAEANGELEVTDDGDVVESEADDEEVEALADELADAEGNGEIEVTEDGDVDADDAGPWTVPAFTNVRITVEPDGGAQGLANLIKKRVPDVDSVRVVDGMVEIIAGDDEEITVTADSLRDRHGIAGTILDVEILGGELDDEDEDEDEADDDDEEEVERVADELAEAEEAGEVEVTDEGDVEADPPDEEVEAIADDLAAAEEAGDVEIDEDGETSVTESGKSQELADLLTEAEATAGSHWKAAHGGDGGAVHEWQEAQKVAYDGRPMKPDGKFGPKSALTIAAQGVDEIPLVRYWPAGSHQATAVAQYKEALRNLEGTDPDAVAVALSRERGQGYGKARALTSGEVLS